MIRSLVETIKSLIWRHGHWEWSLTWRHGHWEWLHEFKTCPASDRHCCHYRWKRDKN